MVAILRQRCTSIETYHEQIVGTSRFPVISYQNSFALTAPLLLSRTDESIGIDRNGADKGHMTQDVSLRW
ncbi:protein of unknown function [uncultured Sphingopyxis sp.]|uniref:Uncharacterized protein n=1 Tax=uncultured Sphingopyxis sp. TaxID=310581 RepID=A0A1Y5PRN3_9SPHN|nr:protein of unknown function [uncultured Sphingopyxis sp.]